MYNYFYLPGAPCRALINAETVSQALDVIKSTDLNKVEYLDRVFIDDKVLLDPNCSKGNIVFIPHPIIVNDINAQEAIQMSIDVFSKNPEYLHEENFIDPVVLTEKVDKDTLRILSSVFPDDFKRLSELETPHDVYMERGGQNYYVRESLGKDGVRWTTLHGDPLHGVLISRQDKYGYAMWHHMTGINGVVPAAKIKEIYPGSSIRVVCLPTLDIAQNFVNGGRPGVTVECEYGSTVIEGKYLTLAHHGGTGDKTGHSYPTEGPYDAPCTSSYPLSISGKRLIAVSHIDPDTIGGIIGLTREINKAPSFQGAPVNERDFWMAMAYLDNNGVHRINEAAQVIRCDPIKDIEIKTPSPELKDKINAFYAWCETNIPRVDRTCVTDVTHYITQADETVRIIMNDKHRNHEKLIEAGKEWAQAKESRAESLLIQPRIKTESGITLHFEPDDGRIRIFDSKDGTFTAASYYSPTHKTVAEITITLNQKTGAITLAIEDGGTRINACNIMQKLFGPEAGGKAGIAGSPRGQRMSYEDLKKVDEAVRGELRNLDKEKDFGRDESEKDDPSEERFEDIER